jgi:hypothetical protein
MAIQCQGCRQRGQWRRPVGATESNGYLWEIAGVNSEQMERGGWLRLGMGRATSPGGKEEQQRQQQTSAKKYITVISHKIFPRARNERGSRQTWPTVYNRIDRQSRSLSGKIGQLSINSRRNLSKQPLDFSEALNIQLRVKRQ